MNQKAPDFKLSQFIIPEAYALYKMGFDLIWIKPNSKLPVDTGWTTNKKLSWPELIVRHKENYNVGVRLGKKLESSLDPSPVNRFLYVIDGDVKSVDKKFQKEINGKLKELFPTLDLKTTPLVWSGRGNGSFHLYITSCVDIGAGGTLAQSKEKVAVFMPSVEPSNYERKTLGPLQLKNGMRLRPAWELALMGKGRQVVLPPSIHPDSKEPYKWGNPMKLSSLPIVDLEKYSKEQRDKEKITHSVSLDFKPIEINLKKRGVSENIIAMLCEGDGVEDRSASLLTVAGALVRCNFSDKEILSVLTERSYFLGNVAYEHRKSDSRKAAIDWIAKYTLPKARKQNDATLEFETEYNDPIPLNETETEKQMKEIVAPIDWARTLERGGKQAGFKLKNTLKNMIKILTNAVAPNIFIENEFSGLELYGVNTPWGGKAGEELRDRDIVRIKVWVSNHYHFEPSNDRIMEAIGSIADTNKFHPVRDWLKALPEWDGIERVNTWMKRLMEAKAPEPYLSDISRKILCAMIARVMKPGTKFDQVLILEGDQGIGKSTIVKTLASPEWFSDSHLNLADKDSVLHLRSAWAIELGELSTVSKSDANQLKEFISRSVDRIRVPYGRKMESYPRQCVFIGTTNNHEYLKDETGNRRFWPVEVGDCDFQALEAEREQLFSEALACYELGETLYLEKRKSQVQAVQVQGGKVMHDALMDELTDFFKKQEKRPLSKRFNMERFKIIDLFSEKGPFGELGLKMKMGHSEQRRVAIILKRLGYRNKIVRKGEDVDRFWIKDESGG